MIYNGLQKISCYPSSGLSQSQTCQLQKALSGNNVIEVLHLCYG